MKRLDLIAKLETVAPALAANDIVPIMTHFWFRGKTLQASNGMCSISVPFKTDFKCAIPGTFLNLLKASGAKDIEFDFQGDSLHATGARTKLRMPTMDPDLFNHDMPAAPTEAIGAKAETFLSAFGSCMRSVSLDGSVPDHLGITVIPGKDHVAMFSSDGTTLSRAEVAIKGNVPFERVIVPNVFCKQLLVLAKGAKSLRLELTKDQCMFAGDNGVVMSGTPVHSEKPRQFASSFNNAHPVENDDKLVPLATRWAKILDRACIVAVGEAKPVRTRIEVKKGRVYFLTTSRLGTVHDDMPLAEPHEDVVIEVPAKALRGGCEDFDRILLTKQCVVMANDYAYYLIAGRN